MARKKGRTPQEIVAKLWQVKVLVGQGESMTEAVRSIGMAERSYNHQRLEYGSLKVEQLKRLKKLERENVHLLKAVSYLPLQKVILKEAAQGK